MPERVLLMPSSWIEKRRTANGGIRHRVVYRLGGRESRSRYAGSFVTKADATARKRWVDGELAAMRVPVITLAEPTVETLARVAERWRASRIDVAEATALTHRTALGRILPVLGSKSVERIAPADVAELVAQLHAEGRARESIRKTLTTLAQVFDFAGVSPNPARDRVAVRLPREDRTEVNPPTAAHVLAIHSLLPSRYRLPLLVLDATGMRVGELERLTWGDVDEQAGRWRVSASVAKTRAARWVPVHPVVFEAVTSLVPREDRIMDARVFADFGAERFRTAMTRACKAAGIPSYSPHDLRHRRATLWHLSGVPVAEAAAWLGHSAQEHLRTYAHATLADRSELDYASLASGDTRLVLPSVPPFALKSAD